MKRLIRKIYVKWLCLIGKAIDISSTSKFPAGYLSNFTPYKFTFRGFEFTSMESLLQGLKFEGVETQNSVFQRVGVKAKLRGKKRKWYLDQTLYWQGTPMKRDSEEYKNIVREAFYALAEKLTSSKHCLLQATNASITLWESLTQRERYLQKKSSVVY